MKIVKNAAAGTMESSDIFICVQPSEKLEVEIDSVVGDQYGDAISQAVRDVLEEYHVESGKFSVTDRGALDCVIRARVETVLKRGGAC